MQNRSNFLQNRSFEHFESFHYFGRLLRHFCYVQQIFKNWKKKSKNLSLSHKKPKIWTCLEVPLFRSHSTVNCYNYQFLKNWKKYKTHLCFKKNPKLERFEQSHFFRTHPTSFLLPLAICKEIMFYICKIHLFFKIKTNFARFQKFCCFSRLLPEICNIEQF